MGAYRSELVKDKPLYCFKLEINTNDLKYNITKIEIPEYILKINCFTERKCYCFENQFINKSCKHYVVEESKLDRFVSSKVYSFNPDIQNAKEIIFLELENKTNEYYTLYMQWKEKLECFLKIK